MKKIDARRLAQYAILVAMEVVLSRFLSFNAWNLKVGFAFVPVALAGMLYGALPAAVIAALADLIGAVLFPSGPFFPGFTLTAFAGGAIYGALLHGKCTALRILAAALSRELLLSLLLNTLWISVLYGSPFLPLLYTRLAQCLGMAPVQFVIILLLSRMLPSLRAVNRASRGAQN